MVSGLSVLVTLDVNMLAAYEVLSDPTVRATQASLNLHSCTSIRKGKYTTDMER
jgi:hypothetical protein